MFIIQAEKHTSSGGSGMSVGIRSTGSSLSSFVSISTARSTRNQQFYRRQENTTVAHLAEQ